jgi:hypothetical protein
VRLRFQGCIPNGGGEVTYMVEAESRVGVAQFEALFKELEESHMSNKCGL